MLSCSIAFAAPIAHVLNGGSDVWSSTRSVDRVARTFEVGTRPRGVAVAGRQAALRQRPDEQLPPDRGHRRPAKRSAAPLRAIPRRDLSLRGSGYNVAAIEENDQVLLIPTPPREQIVAGSTMRRQEPGARVVFSPDGKWLYVSSEEADSVDIVDLGKGRGDQVGQGRRPPRGIGFLPDGSRAPTWLRRTPTRSTCSTSRHAR